MAKIRGIDFEENLKNAMGLEFYNLSHRFGYQSPNWPYFEDVKIERIHYMAKSGVLSFSGRDCRPSIMAFCLSGVRSSCTWPGLATCRRGMRW